ncbi:MAG: hypothetical protein APF81_26335 [Desulfosporosinus sp. BRH_c37]|nr:MAG: hypothetical protein APF81_26335 [Desulfosporosinus sp. BRH_c37]
MEVKYAATMDIYSFQGKEWNCNHPFYEHLREGRLTTTACNDCGMKSYPPRVICPECLSENLEWVDLPTQGKVLVVSEKVEGVPLGFESPLILALIDLGEEFKLVVRITGVKMGELKKGDEVKLHVYPVNPMPVESKNGAIFMQERVFYAFTKV